MNRIFRNCELFIRTTSTTTTVTKSCKYLTFWMTSEIITTHYAKKGYTFLEFEIYWIRRTEDQEHKKYVRKKKTNYYNEDIRIHLYLKFVEFCFRFIRIKLLYKYLKYGRIISMKPDQTADKSQEAQQWIDVQAF